MFYMFYPKSNLKKGEWRKERTFFPGLPSTVPTIFSRTPSTLSFTLVFLGGFFVAGALDFVTLPDVVA